MRQYLTSDPAYSIATGNIEFPSQKTCGSKNTLAVVCSGINSSDVEIEVEQSVDDVNFGPVPGSKQVLSIGQVSHMWNINGLPGGIYLRVILRKGTATAGILQSIKLLSDE